METRTKHRLITLLIIAGVLLALTLGVFQSNRALNKILSVEKQTSTKALDSIISEKIDYRYTSYDNRFFYSNLVVTDEKGEIIGKLYLYTNEKEIDSFYNSDVNWRRTKFFDNLKNGSLKILPKINN